MRRLGVPGTTRAGQPDASAGPARVRPYDAGMPWRRRTVAVSACVAVLALVAGWAWPTPRLAAPTGPHPIGTTRLVWTDMSRPEITSSDPTRRRTLVAQAWYPAAAPASGVRARYLADPAFTEAASGLLGLPDWLLIGVRTATTVAFEDVRAADGRHPVIIACTGLAGSRSLNSFQALELASHGYVVVALDQPGASAAVTLPDGSVAPVLGLKPTFDPLLYQGIEPSGQVPVVNGHALPTGIVTYLAADVTSAIDHLSALARDSATLGPHLDLRHIGATGVSLGGATVAEASAHDHRIGATLVLEAPLTRAATATGLTRPVMVITRGPDAMRRERRRMGGWNEHEIEVHQRTQRAVFNKAPGEAWFVRIDSLSHLDFTDVSEWTPVLRATGRTGPLDARRGHEIVNGLGLAFFDHTLRGAAPTPDRVAATWPEAAVDARP